MVAHLREVWVWAVSIDRLIDNYVEAVRQYNSEAPFTCPSYSDIEGRVLEIGWAVVRLSGRGEATWTPRPGLFAAADTYRKQQVTPSTRWQVWERDDFTCQHCGTRRDLSIDHILAESRGGGVDLDNLQTLCKSCNSRKGPR